MKSKIFAQKLKKARNQSGFTQVEVAKLLNIDKSTLAKYETGDREPDLDKLVDIAEFFNVTTDWLLGIGKKLDSETYADLLNESKNRESILNITEKEAKKAI